MITSRAWSGKRYAVLGLARSGAATVDALLASGAEVVAWDENEESRAKLLPGTGRGTAAAGGGGGGVEPSEGSRSTARAENPLHHAASRRGPPPRAGEDLQFADPLTLDLSTFNAVVVSPGVPLNCHPIAAAARAAGVPLIGDIELFAQARASLPPHKVVGITGTNGKSTTTALVHHILRTAGVPTTMGGNIGLPILAQEPLPEGGVYVLELSSYQIDLTHGLDCDVAVLLNITPDHLDRYESFEDYAASKARLLGMQSLAHVAVIATNDRSTLKIAGHLQDSAKLSEGLAQSQQFSHASEHFLADAALRRGRVVRVSKNTIGDQSAWPALQGPHNAQNVAAALAVSKVLGTHADAAERALATFPGLPHRMERVADRAGTLFVNDSKATNPASTAPALAAFDAVHWILGGRAKTAELDACLPHLGHVRVAYTIGEAGPMFAKILGDKVPVVDCERLTRAVTEAAAAARPGEVVLLSPAAASFDQFTDFEARGDAFRAAVEALQ